MEVDWDKILKEVVYKANTANLNFKNPIHLEALQETLFEFDWNSGAIIEFISNLKMNENDIVKNKKSGNEYVVKQHNPETQDLITKDASEEDIANIKSKDNDLVKISELGGDSKSRLEHIKNGFVRGAAPGNPGSMYNEIMSGEVANFIRSSHNKSEQDLVRKLITTYGNSNLAKQNLSNKTAGGLKAADFAEYKDLLGDKNSNRELVSKSILAVRSGMRKYNRAVLATNNLGWKHTIISEYFGDKHGLKNQENDIKSASKIVDLDGNEIPKDEIIKLIRNSGGGENPSDTSTIIKNKDTGEATILFTSDKDSVGAIISQSTPSAELIQSDDVIFKLSDTGKLSQTKSEAIAGERRNYAEKLHTIENKLKSVTKSPVKFLNDNFDNKIANNIINSSAGANSRKYFEPIRRKFVLGEKIPNIDKKYSDFLPKHSESPPTDEQVSKAFLNYALSGIKELTMNEQKIINRANLKAKGPDVYNSVEQIRKDSINLLDKQIKELDQIDIGGIGVGTYIEGNNVWDQGHLGAISAKNGVHKYKGMFETNHAGVVLNGNILKHALGVNSKDEFLKKLKIGKTKFQISKDNRITGSTGLVYMVVGEKKVPIMEKRERTKNGPLGKLQSVYKWTPEFQDLIKENQ